MSYSLIVAAAMPISVKSLSPRVQDLHKRVKDFIETHVFPLEKELEEYHRDPEKRWTIHPRVEELKVCGGYRFGWPVSLTANTFKCITLVNVSLFSCC